MNNEKWLQELGREWIFHNSIHNCYYVDGPDSGVTRCPAEYGTFHAFCSSRGFPVEFLVDDENDQISGQENDSTNFRSEVENAVILDRIEELYDVVENLRSAMGKMVDSMREQVKASRMIVDMIDNRLEKKYKLEMSKPAYKAYSGPVEEASKVAKDYYSSLQNYDRLENGISERSGAGSKPEINITYDSKYSTIQSQKIKDIVEEELKRESYFRRGHGFAGT